MAGVGNAESRARGCSRPIRLVGSRESVNTTTGEITTVYSSDQELDGRTYVRCGNRRASVCPSCSHEYKGDAWHLLICGLAGGKGVPANVADHPCTFVTLTAPSFGAVHGQRRTGLCRPRRDHPVCPHGRALWCSKRHDEMDPQVGQPLCGKCLDYVRHVLWQWHAPELWRRFTIARQRALAKKADDDLATSAPGAGSPSRKWSSSRPAGWPTSTPHSDWMVQMARRCAIITAADRGRPRGCRSLRGSERDAQRTRQGGDGIRAWLGTPGRHAHDQWSHGTRRPVANHSPPGAGGGLPREVPDEEHRGLRPERQSPVPGARTPARSQPARRAHHRHG